jgi:hypothetical protein
MRPTFINVGERTNVTVKFKKLIVEGDYTAEFRTVASCASRPGPRSSTSTWTRACSTRSRRCHLPNLIAEPDIARVLVDSKWR